MMMMKIFPASLFVCRAAVYALKLEAPGNDNDDYHFGDEDDDDDYDDDPCFPLCV